MNSAQGHFKRTVRFIVDTDDRIRHVDMTARGTRNLVVQDKRVTRRGSRWELEPFAWALVTPTTVEAQRRDLGLRHHGQVRAVNAQAVELVLHLQWIKTRAREASCLVPEADHVDCTQGLPATGLGEGGSAGPQRRERLG